MTGVLPEVWTAVKLSDVCQINPRGKSGLADDDEVSFVPMSAVSESSGTIVGAETRTLKDVRRGFTPFQEGDVLFAKITPCMENGKAAIARNLVNQWGYGSTEFHVVRPSPLVLSEWIFAIIRTMEFRRAAASSFQGAVGQQRVTSSFLERFRIPLPPLSEQQRIVEILQEAEAIRRLRAEAEAKTAELIPGLFRDRIANYGREVRWARIGDVLRVKSGEFLPSSMMKTGRYPVYGGNGVSGYHDAYMFVESTVCIGRVGAYCGAVHLTSPRSWITDNALYVSERLVDLDLHYLTEALTAAQLNRYASQAGQPLISAGRIYPVKIPILPIERQRMLSETIIEVEKLRNENLESGKLGTLLESALSAHAFSGQLTADWRAAHADKLALEARERDAALKQTGASVTRSRRATIQETESIFEQRTDGIYSDLNREQRELLFRIQQQVGGVDYARYFSAQSLAQSMEGPMRRHPQAIEGHLAVLAARGLIIPVSREEQTKDTGEFVFGNAYRLPLQDRNRLLATEAGGRLTTESGDGIVVGQAIGDRARGRELERLAAQLEKERALT